MKNKSFLMTIAIAIIAINSVAQVKGTFTDTRDGKVYKTVKIGTQTWMAENLAYKASSGCWAYDNNQNNVKIYGYLYKWETAKKVCPSGWHLPSDYEWTILTNYLGGEDIAGGKLKSTLNWNSPNQGATNSSGFAARPGGSFINIDEIDDGTYGNIGSRGFWWTSAEATNDCPFSGLSKTFFAKSRVLGDNLSEILSGEILRTEGCSVRCVKD